MCLNLKETVKKTPKFYNFLLPYLEEVGEDKTISLYNKIKVYKKLFSGIITMKFDSFESLSDYVENRIIESDRRSFVKRFISSKYQHLVNDKTILLFDALRKQLKLEKHSEINNIISKIASFKTSHSFNKHLEDSIDKLGLSWNIDFLETKILNSSAKVVFKNETMIICLVTNYHSMKMLGSENWCIVRDKNTFNRYVNLEPVFKLPLNSQYIIFNTEYDQTHGNSMIGVTVKRDGTKFYVSNAHDRFDKECAKKIQLSVECLGLLRCNLDISVNPNDITHHIDKLDEYFKNKPLCATDIVELHKLKERSIKHNKYTDIVDKGFKTLTNKIKNQDCSIIIHNLIVLGEIDCLSYFEFNIQDYIKSLESHIDNKDILDLFGLKYDFSFDQSLLEDRIDNIIASDNVCLFKMITNKHKYYDRIDYNTIEILKYCLKNCEFNFKPFLEYYSGKEAIFIETKTILTNILSNHKLKLDTSDIKDLAEYIDASNIEMVSNRSGLSLTEVYRIVINNSKDNPNIKMIILKYYETISDNVFHHICNYNLQYSFDETVLVSLAKKWKKYDYENIKKIVLENNIATLCLYKTQIIDSETAKRLYAELNSKKFEYKYYNSIMTKLDKEYLTLISNSLKLYCYENNFEL